MPAWFVFKRKGKCFRNHDGAVIMRPEKLRVFQWLPAFVRMQVQVWILHLGDVDRFMRPRGALENAISDSWRSRLDWVNEPRLQQLVNTWFQHRYCQRQWWRLGHPLGLPPSYPSNAKMMKRDAKLSYNSLYREGGMGTFIVGTLGVSGSEHVMIPFCAPVREIQFMKERLASFKRSFLRVWYTMQEV